MTGSSVPAWAIARSWRARKAAASNGSAVPCSSRSCATRHASSPSRSRGSSSSAHSRRSAVGGPGSAGAPGARSGRVATSVAEARRVGVVEQQQLGDEAAHAPAEHVGPRDLVGVQHGQRVGGEGGHAVRGPLGAEIGVGVHRRRRAWPARVGIGRGLAPA